MTLSKDNAEATAVPRVTRSEAWMLNCQPLFSDFPLLPTALDDKKAP
jgi:hypothetical protein